MRLSFQTRPRRPTLPLPMTPLSSLRFCLALGSRFLPHAAITEPLLPRLRPSPALFPRTTLEPGHPTPHRSRGRIAALRVEARQDRQHQPAL